MVKRSFLSLEGITKRYGRHAALDSVDVEIARGDFVTLLGPSGSGKSTALMAIAGFVLPEEGRITFDGTDITRVPPERRGFGVVFQGYALFPHMTVAANIAYPLEVRGESRAAIDQKVRRVLDLVQLLGMEERRPSMLSGGQQQRVAIARALVYEPPLLLLDEPLSALDRKLRGELQAGLKALHARLGTTFVNVTHDQEEALGLSTKVVLLSRGRVAQQGSPGEIYDRPRTAFVADFIGNANVLALDGMSQTQHGWVGQAGTSTLRLLPLHPVAAGGKAMVAIRQEAIGLGAPPAWDCDAIEGTVIDVERIGPVVRVLFDGADAGLLRLSMPATVETPTSGTATHAWWRVADAVHVLDERS
ncbi:MAG: ABC transporter ATP-binding protein [Rhizobiaceae bacterium]|nr:ABC transporter ATP-binding protein [Rhizobiaceae bacterium]